MLPSRTGAGIMMLLAALIVLPPANKFLATKLHVSISGALKFILVIVLFSIGLGMLAGSPSDSQTTDELPAAAESPTVSYQQVFSFSGSGIKKSEPFTITGSRFKIKYDCTGSLCQAFLYKVGSDFPAGGVMNTAGPTKDETVQYGAGTYYIEANTLGQFSMTVEDYR